MDESKSVKETKTGSGAKAPEKKMSAAKKILIAVVCVFLSIILIVGGYVAYVFIAYHRVGDQTLEVENAKEAASAAVVGEEYKIMSYNIGFGAYEDDYGFFMDGGDKARAWSKDRLEANLKNIVNVLKEENADLCLVQEVDVDSTRTYGVDEREYLKFDGMSRVYAENWDSPYLFYPIGEPHGAAQTGIVTLSSFGVTSARRVELPVETGVMKIIDLDRCYSKSRIPVIKDGKAAGELVLYNFHLSAYTSDGKIAEEQLEMLLTDMEHEYALGNYCVAGGDFNKDILGDSSKYFGKSDVEYTWAQPIPEGMVEAHGVKLVAPLDEKDPVPSCRNADGAYHKGQYVLTIDGFLVTANVTVKYSEVVDTQFRYSDHNPVAMTFELGR